MSNKVPTYLNVVRWHAGADVSVKNMTKMPALSDEMSSVTTAQDCMNAAQNAELVAALDQTITGWCKEIEKVHPHPLEFNRSFKNVSCVVSVNIHLRHK